MTGDRAEDRIAGRRPDAATDEDELIVRFRRWSALVERRLLRAVVWLLALLAVSQLLLQLPAVRSALTGTDGAEGVRYHG